MEGAEDGDGVGGEGEDDEGEDGDDDAKDAEEGGLTSRTASPKQTSSHDEGRIKV